MKHPETLFRHINIFTKVQGVYIMDLLVDLGKVEEDPSLWTLILGKDAKKNLRSYPCKTSFTEERKPQERGGPSQERFWRWNDKVQCFSK